MTVGLAEGTGRIISPPRRVRGADDDLSPIRLRAAEAGDALVATEIARAAKAHWGYPVDWFARWAPELTITPEYIQAHTVTVAVAGSHVVGVCALEQRPADWSLGHLWVRPEWHGCGIGRQLLLDALATAARIRPGIVEIEADPGAAGFYERLGARRTRERPAPMPGEPQRTLPILVFDVAAAAAG